MSLKLLLLFSICGISVCFCKECNPLACFYHFNSVFIYEEESNTCLKLGKLRNCISSCLQFVSLDDKTFVGNFRSVESIICKDEQEMELENILQNKCLNRKKYRLMSCLYEAWNLESNSTADEKLVTCRKLSETEYCPDNVLLHCEEESRFYIENLLVKSHESMKEKYCSSYSQKSMLKLGVKNRLIDTKAYQHTAKCLDLHHESILSCVPDKWTTNYVLNQHVQTKMCSAFKISLDCMESVVGNCDQVAKRIVDEFGQFVFQTFLPNCFQMQDHLVGSEDQSIRKSLHHTHAGSNSNIPMKLSNSDDSSGSVNSTDNQPSEIIIIHFGTLNLSGAEVSKSSVVFLVLFPFVLLLC